MSGFKYAETDHQDKNKDSVVLVEFEDERE
jgi:hypothetical protein